MTAPTPDTAAERARELWQDILEKDDRTSPEEYPDMALITFEEFAANLRFAEAAAVQRERERAIDAAIWAVHDVGLPPGENNLTLRETIARAVADAIRKGAQP